MDSLQATELIKQLRRIADALERAHPGPRNSLAHLPPPPQALAGEPIAQPRF